MKQLSQRLWGSELRSRSLAREAEGAKTGKEKEEMLDRALKIGEEGD